MVDVTIYASAYCGYCARAKQLLDTKDVAYREIDVTMSPEKRGEMMQRAGGRSTVPQIFIGETYVGGCDELYALDRAGKLDALLEAA